MKVTKRSILAVAAALTLTGCLSAEGRFHEEEIEAMQGGMMVSVVTLHSDSLGWAPPLPPLAAGGVVGREREEWEEIEDWEDLWLH